ncbi:TIGR03621 family F420-dependent LLM class oxidoreductase [Rugosimonospora africana]|uniref:N5,N10-methylene tetrahydromethanopterin reductase n=1 Tax=Rugosimonospora africana TaxID=556532 RepID=A0A8J3QUU0_9ACTN|nr:TIGR03621 family F420-dependent LLM class oxidoreductase [Rugosimonospora africana]GIH16859.1 N5,N10-methylene tetrahydromethanopterin reductase [Rugosimonospora africana]
MTDRLFRFGVVAGSAPSAQAWLTMGRRAEQLGYNVLLVPDTQNTLSPFPALAALSAATSALCVGTYVLSAPNRTPGTVAHETASLDMLSAGRFELGLGAGRPGAQHDAARLGVPFGTPGQRVQRLADTIREVKQSGEGTRTTGVERAVAQPRPPILVAGSGPRVLRLAAEQADIVALGTPPQAPEEELAAKVADLRRFAAGRFDQLEIAANLAAVADRLEDLPGDGWLARQVGGDPRIMAATGGTAFLIGTPAQLADTLRRRRDTLGISYITVSGMFLEQFAPVVERLAGT